MKSNARTALVRCPSFPENPGATPSFRRRCSLFRHFLFLVLLTTVLTAAAGCASVPSYRAHPELQQRRGAIRTIGLLPPVITLSEEQPRFGLNKLIEQVLWSSAAADAVARAFSEEMAADHVSLATISTDDMEVKDLIDLYNAVEFSIERHAWEKRSGEMVPRETFPEKVRTFDYSLGPAREVMERYNVDAVWIVRGFNLLPTTGTKVKEGAEVLLAVMAALGGAPVPLIQYKKIELRVALVDRTGSVLYYGVADEDRAGQPVGELPAESAAAGDVPAGTAGRAYVAVDLRDLPVARYYLKAALAQFRTGAAP